MKIIYLLLALLSTSTVFSQTWSDDVAEIFYNKCSGCHRNGGIAPFSLVTYSETSPLASMIQASVSNENMPPYPPDENYQQYAHSKSLSPAQKSTILTWISNGAPEGVAANTPPPPVWSNESILGAGDLTIQIPTYMSKANGFDDYVCFSVPSGLTANRTIKAIEVIPGNRQIVHHALIYVDAAASYPTDTVGGDCAGPATASTTLIHGYTPGASPIVFPSASPFKLGMPMPAGSNVVFAMHYPNGSFGEYDSTKVILHFYPLGETGIRQVTAAPILQNWSLAIPPGATQTYSATYPASGTLPTDYTILSVFPHMHLLGTDIKVYGLDAAADSIPFIHIPAWDFHWQDFYFFKNPIKAPTGSKFKVDGTYHNTTGSMVFAGEATTDEMLIVYSHFMTYLPGDELYDLEVLMSASIEEIQKKETGVSVHPVPFTDKVYITPETKAGDHVSIAIYDMMGKLIQVLAKDETVSTTNQVFEWNGLDASSNLVSNGTYQVSILLNGEMKNAKIIKQ